MPQAPANPLRYVRTTLTRWAAGLIFATASVYGLTAVLYVAAGDEYEDYLIDPPAIEDPLAGTAEAADIVYGIGGVALLATVIVFLAWFNRAYKAAASRGLLMGPNPFDRTSAMPNPAVHLDPAVSWQASSLGASSGTHRTTPARTVSFGTSPPENRQSAR